MSHSEYENELFSLKALVGYNSCLEDQLKSSIAELPSGACTAP